MLGLVLYLLYLLNQVGANDTSTCNSMGLHFWNWDGEKSCLPNGYLLPHSEEDIVEVIQRAALQGDKVKVIGAGMSFSGVQMVDDGAGILVSLDKMQKIIRVTPNGEGALVEVEAGIRVRTLCEELGALKLALPNLGATATQSFIGAASTGTHGTGLGLGAIATQIVALRIIDASGKVHIASETENIALFNAARVGVGALGIISTVTLKTIPLWKMTITYTPYLLSQLLADLPNLMQTYPRLQFSWVPYTDNATLVTRTDVPWNTPLSPSAPDGGCWSDTQSTQPSCTDVSYKTLTDSQAHYDARSLYTEMEMFIPYEQTIAAVKSYNAVMEELKPMHDPSVQISTMIRFVAADDIDVSPMHGRDTAVLSFIVVGDQKASGNQKEFDMYASALQRLCEESFQGRPHWGKRSFADENTPAYLAASYGKGWGSFLDMKKKLDPTGVFQNAFLHERGL